MAITKLLGFAVIKGGPDLPAGYDENENFGFDINAENEATGPIFNYSVRDVEDKFQECYSMESHTQILSGCTLRLYAETSDNIDLKSEQFTTDIEWKKAFKLIEWTINNQTNIVNLNSSDKGYTNYADQHLGAELINQEVNSERIDTYVLKSFSFVPSQAATKKNRIGVFTFQINMKDAPVFFQIYLDADDFCSGSSTEDLMKSVFVYYFKEINHDGKLDNEELLESVNNPFFEAFNRRKYKRQDVFDTRWFKRRNPNDPSQGYETESVTRRFVIYSNFKKEPDTAFPIESRMEAVRNALIQDYGADGPDGNKIVTEDLITQYPDLFSRNEVLLIHFGNNNSLQITGGDLIQGMHPITIVKLLNTAKKYGYSLQTDAKVTTGISMSELFFVGGETPNEGTTNTFRFPLLAIEKTSKTIKPISNRFPTYAPKFFSNDWPSTDSGDQFQFILAKCLGALEGKYTEEQLNSINSVVRFTVQKAENGLIETISFQFANARWILDNTSTDDKIR